VSAVRHSLLNFFS